MSKDSDYEKRILDCLSENVFGLTITAIAEKTNISRNTVYRYVGILETQHTIYNKRVGTYNLYFSKKKSMLFRDTVTSFFKILLSFLKEEFPEKEVLFKECGKKIGESYTPPFADKGREEFERLKELTDVEVLESLESWVIFFNILFDTIEVSNIEINEAKKEGIYTFINSEMLASDNHIYYFYILAGMAEKRLSMITNKKVVCDVLDYKIFDEIENNYIKYKIKIS
jgi:hypothetical protein